jgi:hypothetical protein
MGLESNRARASTADSAFFDMMRTVSIINDDDGPAPFGINFFSTARPAGIASKMRL